jgi:hypothetical protein
MKNKITLIFLLILVIPMVFVILSRVNRHAEIGKEFIGVGGKKTILLEPDKWTEKEFPLLPYIQPINMQEKLKNGEWMVVLYHYDCPECKEVIDELIEKKTENLFLMEVPPYGESVFLENINCARLNESESKEWFVTTPVILTIKNHVVVQVIMPKGNNK